jgi:hypothetical protein
MQFLLQGPIVVDVVRQPPVTPEITLTDVIVGAVGTAGILMLLSLLAGLLAGAIIIYFKKRAEAASPTSESSHARLGISRVR